MPTFVGAPGSMEVFYTNLASAMGASVVLAFFIETGLGYLFGMKWYSKLNGKGLKAPISFAVCYLCCYVAGFDFFAWVFGATALSWLTTGITALFLAGGSKSISHRFGELKRTLASTK